MKQVSKDGFYDVVGPLDVVLTLTEKYPYTTTFKLRGGEVVGIDKADGTYWVNERFLHKERARNNVGRE